MSVGMRSPCGWTPFLCEAAPNPFNFFLSLCPLRPLRFVFLSCTYGLAHLHTELV
ncbi:hypothetical protein [Nostoc sp.]|uniref:hypothetical protein n=1 Tax=Nostoc sp. TaxID=1180 RepID=UPI002FF97960